MRKITKIFVQNKSSVKVDGKKIQIVKVYVPRLLNWMIKKVKPHGPSTLDLVPD